MHLKKYLVQYNETFVVATAPVIAIAVLAVYEYKVNWAS